MSRRRRRSAASVPRGPVLTRRGWVLIGAAGAGVAIGVWQREPSFVHVGLFVLVMVAVGWWLARHTLDGIEIERTAPPSGFVGDLIPVTVRLTRTTRGLGARAVDFSDELLGALGEGASATRLRPGETLEYSGESRLRRRGRDPVFRWELQSAFPAGIWISRRGGWHTMPMTVFPRPVRPADLDDPRAAADESDDDVLWRPLPDWGGDYLGIREFVPGDPLKHVHWRATARAQRLVVREFDQRLPASYALFFHSYLPEGLRRGPDAFESALELLTGLLLRCREDGVPLSLSADFLAWRTLTLTGSRPLLAPLEAFAEARWAPLATLEPLVAKLAAVPAGSHVFVVSDSALRHWQGKLPGGPFELTCLSVGEMRRRRPFVATRSIPGVTS